MLTSTQAVSSMIGSLNPNVRGMVIDTLWACVQDLREDVRENSLMPFIVRKEKRKGKKVESPKLERKVGLISK